MDGTHKRPANAVTPKGPAPAKEFKPKEAKSPEPKPALIGIAQAPAAKPAPAVSPVAPPLVAAPAIEPPKVAPLIIPDIGRLPESKISAPHIPLPDAPEPVPAAHPVEAATPGLARPAPDAWAAFAESQAALARGLEALSIEMTGFARSGFSVAAETATAMLRVRTLGDAMALNAGFARQSFDALIGSSAKLSEIGVKLATDASRPLLSRFGESWKSGSIGV